MKDDPAPPRRSALLGYRFLGATLAGTLAMALVSLFAPLPAQVAVLGTLVSMLGGLILDRMRQDDERERHLRGLLSRMSVPLALAPDAELMARYGAICEGLAALAEQDDPVLREAALLKLSSLASQVSSLAAGIIVFESTEAWRTVYDVLLRSRDVREYRSAAWVRSPEYWQDQPGRRSMEANFDAAHRGTLVERIIILRDDLWPIDSLLPGPGILPWIEEQHAHGLRIALVRESDLSREAGLLADSGIYGHRAVGTQELDDHCRTLRFTLEFGRDPLTAAEERWRRLTLYATPFHELLDRAEAEG